MSKLLKNSTYVKQIQQVVNEKINWEEIKGKTFLITGASGMIGSLLIDVLMYRNRMFHDNIKIIAVYRNQEVFDERFRVYLECEEFRPLLQDINTTIQVDESCDYIIHGASNTHPKQYALDPIGTINANTIGTYQILEFAAKQTKARTIMLSSVEIYGENRGDVTYFTEDYCGYIDCNTLRAGYPESKRCAEALCQAYIEAKKLDIIIARLSRVYGPTMRQTDTKAIAQFIKKAVDREEVVLKSQGNQLYAYTYVADVVSALLYLLLYGQCGKAYNIADQNSNITLKELAEICANIAKTKVVYEVSETVESKGYSKATKALLKTDKIEALGWIAKNNIYEGIISTVEILKQGIGEKDG